MPVFLKCSMKIICVVSLQNLSPALNFGTGSVSWWEVNGFGCRPVYPTNITEELLSGPPRPESVLGCVLNYEHVEVLHASLQIVLAVS